MISKEKTKNNINIKKVAKIYMAHIDMSQSAGRPSRGKRGQWTVDSGQWTVGSGQWTVDSGQWTVDSGQWTHVSPGRLDAYRLLAVI